MVLAERVRSVLAGCWGACLLLAMVAGAAPAVAAAAPEEQQLIASASAFERELAQRGLIFTEPRVRDHVAAVGARVAATVAAPPQPLRFHVLRDPTPNAFALPSGGIYVTLGLLARMENAAQLALVLAHEAAHITHHHALQKHQSRRRKIVAAHITDLVLMGTSIAYLPFVASIASYSREMETEADHTGLDYLIAAGYDGEAAVRLFAVLEEIPTTESVLGSIYASHPYSANREAALRARLPAPGDATVAATDSAYLAVRLRALRESAELKLGIGHYELARRAAITLAELVPEDPQGRYLMAEAWRQMAAQPELAAAEQALLRQTQSSDKLVDEMRRQQHFWLDSAVTAYGQALAIDPAYGPAYRGLGLVAQARDDTVAMREHLARYLALTPQARDRRYIEHLLSTN